MWVVGRPSRVRCFLDCTDSEQSCLQLPGRMGHYSVLLLAVPCFALRLPVGAGQCGSHRCVCHPPCVSQAELTRCPRSTHALPLHCSFLLPLPSLHSSFSFSFYLFPVCAVVGVIEQVSFQSGLAHLPSCVQGSPWLGT